MTRPETEYRADIDGLRAIAVAAVIAYHAFPAYFGGGFAGVDIFFVISGFLISRLILADIDAGRFAIARFYARRVRRIFPALLVVLFSCSLAGWLVMLPNEWASLGRDVFAGSAFVSNLALAVERSNYFALAAHLRPLLHLWSLGVEEQFYLVWPLLLFALRGQSARSKIGVLAAIAIASFALNVAMVTRHQAMTFYLPVTRVWELALGSLLAAGEWERWMTRRRAEEASWIGIAMCVTSMLVIDAKHFPGVWALGPTLGTFLLIACGPATTFNRRVLSSPLAVRTGLISYPLYLWHWPLLCVLVIWWNAAPPPAYALVAILAAVVLAALTYTLIEMPVRSAPVTSKRLRMVCAGMVVIAAVGLAAASGRLPGRLHGAGVDRVVTAMNDWTYPFGGNYARRDHFIRSDVAAGQPGGAVLLVGDSHVEQYWPRMELLAAAKATPPLRLATNGGCAPLRGLTRDDRAEVCDAFLDFAIAEARRPDVARVVFGADWSAYLGERADRARVQRALAEFASTIADLRQRGKEVDVILTSPSSPRFSPRSMISLVTGRLAPPPPVPVDELDASLFASDALLRVAGSRGGANVVDPLPSVCPNGLCPTFDTARGPVFRDRGHLRPFYVRERALFVDRLLARHESRTRS